jgi:hypothetical protein
MVVVKNLVILQIIPKLRYFAGQQTIFLKITKVEMNIWK